MNKVFSMDLDIKSDLICLGEDPQGNTNKRHMYDWEWETIPLEVAFNSASQCTGILDCYFYPLVLLS